MSQHVGLAALIVNYNSGAFAVRCVESLLCEWRREGRPSSKLQIVVVDNASPEDQESCLLELERLGAKVVRHDENAGYARGMNLALVQTEGGPEDVVAILNPDLHFLPGSVGTLIDYLQEHPECGAVDPRACIDPLGVLNLPRNLLPTASEQVYMNFCRLSPALCRSYSKMRLKYALPWWSAEGPVEANMLSGCCVFLRRDVVERLPYPLMDERYPLYYEDTDLFRTLGQLGYKLVHHGAARVLHYWSRSSGVGGQFAGEPQRRYEISQREYFKRFAGPVGRAMIGMARRFCESRPAEKQDRPMYDLVDLGVFADPVVIPLPREARFLIELAIAPTWLVAVGIFGEGHQWVCPAETWDWFFQAEYYMRAIDLDNGEFLGAWRFQKSTPGRVTPVTDDEIQAYGERLFGGGAA